MDTPYIPGHREVALIKLRLPYEKDGEPLNRLEFAELTRQGIIRSSHYVWLAERYMADLSKLGGTPELDEHLAALSEVAAYMDRLLSAMVGR